MTNIFQCLKIEFLSSEVNVTLFWKFKNKIENGRPKRGLLTLFFYY